MAREYFVCDVVELPDEEFGTLRQPVINTVKFPDGTTVNFKYDEQHDWALCIVHHPLQIPRVNLPGVDRLPEFPLDAKVNAMHGPTKQAMESVFSRRGIAKTYNDSDGFRSVIRSLGREFDPNFNEDEFGPQSVSSREA